MTYDATIYALSTAPGKAGVAVLRVSGKHTGAAVTAIAGALPVPRRASLRTLRRPEDGVALDQSLVLWMPGPGSFTGEDCAEFHVHGGTAVVAGVLTTLGRLPNLRMAEPGEFTRRAFESGKLDLTAAEGLADLIDAQTEAQRMQALRQAGGELATVAERWRAELIHAMGLVEAAIDFSDEGDVADRATGQAYALAEALQRELTAALDDGRRGEIIRDGLTVVIAGPPNAGKSSLLNALARRDVAIVSDEPGTTRDVLEVRLDIEGMAVTVIDTAGIRDAPGAVEREGVRRALARASDGDLVLWVSDATAAPVAPPAALRALGDRLVMVENKVDLLVGRRPSSGGGLPASAISPDGLDQLLAEIGRRAQTGSARESPLITRSRHRTLIAAAATALRAFLDGEQSESELRAEDLRQAAQAIGKLTGRVDPEEVLGEIFGRFCIGK